MRLDHALLEADLSDLLVCVVDEPVGGTSQGQSPTLKLLGGKSSPLMMHLARMSCQCDYLKCQRGHLAIIMRINGWRQLCKRTSFWSNIGAACSQRFVGE